MRFTWSQLTKRSALVQNLLMATRGTMFTAETMTKVAEEINNPTSVADGTQTEDVPAHAPPIYPNSPNDSGGSDSESGPELADSVNAAVTETGTGGAEVPMGAIGMPDMAEEAVGQQGTGQTAGPSIDNADDASATVPVVVDTSSSLLDVSSPPLGQVEDSDATDDEAESDHEAGRGDSDNEGKSNTSSTSDEPEVHGGDVDDSESSDGSESEEEAVNDEKSSHGLALLWMDLSGGRVEDETFRRLWRGFNRLCL